MTTTDKLAELRKRTEKLESAAAEAKAELIKAAVDEAVTSTVYGHVSAVAKRAGISSQYLRELVEENHPGWLAEAAAERKASKTAGSGRRRGAQAA
ncbi:hypothetical protein [Streptomyces sp. NPDC007369]|uniref:hypothetical protein n=1 Tax=Streptomyces sp. NPDC007369 TaxID=3154589 RepID=UPI0034037AE8